MKIIPLYLICFCFLIFSQDAFAQPPSEEDPVGEVNEVADNFSFEAEQFADIRVLRYQVPGFDELDVKIHIKVLKVEMFHKAEIKAVIGRIAAGIPSTGDSPVSGKGIIRQVFHIIT